MIFILLLIAIPLASNAAAQAAVTSFTLPDPNVCHGGYGLTTFKACNLYASSLQLCESSRECYCKPEVLSAVYNCENEMIACQGNNDQNMLWQNVASAYHSACDSYTTFPFSTPGIISLSSFVEPNICTSLDKACIEGYYSNSQCSKSYFSSPQSFGDCLCNPSLLSLRYDCLYLGGIYCSSVGSPFPNISTILGWSVCAGYQTIMIPRTPQTLALTTNDGVTSGGNQMESSSSALTSTISATVVPRTTSPSTTAFSSSPSSSLPGPSSSSTQSLGFRILPSKWSFYRVGMTCILWLFSMY